MKQLKTRSSGHSGIADGRGEQRVKTSEAPASNKERLLLGLCGP